MFLDLESALYKQILLWKQKSFFTHPFVSEFGGALGLKFCVFLYFISIHGMGDNKFMVTTPMFKAKCVVCWFPPPEDIKTWDKYKLPSSVLVYENNCNLKELTLISSLRQTTYSVQNENETLCVTLTTIIHNVRVFTLMSVCNENHCIFLWK